MMRRRAVALLIGITCAITTSGITSSLAATPKVGGSCTKVGLVSGTLTCTKLNGKLVWQKSKKSQAISFSAPTQSSVNDKSAKFSFSASSGLTVKATVLTKPLCSLASGEIRFTGSVGKCQISLTQSGNSTFLAAPNKTVAIIIFGVNELDFQLPGALLLTQGSLI